MGKNSYFFRQVGLTVLAVMFGAGVAQAQARQHIKFDAGWNFAFGHPYDVGKDFYNGTGYFSYLSKAGYGDGAAAPGFDARAWRKLDLPHDWAVEQPISEKGSFSHGFKAIGRNFPDASVGWYRKTFTIPATDLGQQISIAFDGVFRNCIVWVNGHYLGTNASGYLGFEHTITDYLNYGGDNVVAVRVDATMEEGWFYEGAGIYRHVWLNKTNPLHIAPVGTYADTKSLGSNAVMALHTRINNAGRLGGNVSVEQKLLDAGGQVVATTARKEITLQALQQADVNSEVTIANPTPWSIENPHLYQLLTNVYEGDKEIDSYRVNVGIRTVRFDANEGFFLNGKHVKLKGTNNHQDHAGVGAAMPDSLQVFRVKRLKAFGSNAYRCSHNPPTPELLDACDRLGMLVIDENRLMGITGMHLGDVKRMIERDRSHPCIFSWSIGNEEWNMEGSITGARVAATMQAFVKSIDTTRGVTAAVSGGWGGGISSSIDVMGYNYITHGSTDAQHKQFPMQAGMGTEEGSTRTTRGIYFDDMAKHYLSAYDVKPEGFVSIHEGWQYYNSRPYLAGMFIWTGFDYRGEPTPFGWPSVYSYFGMVDACGFPKDNFYYLRSWWTDTPTLHLLPHWNLQGKEGQEIDVWAYSNCDEVELFLNKKSLGKKKMLKDAHVSWMVKYSPGVLEAVGYKAGKKITTEKVQTTGEPAAIALASDRAAITAGKESVAMVTVSAKDEKGLAVPTAGNNITFTIQGPGKLVGVGNGDPTSLEPEQCLETIEVIKVRNLKEKVIDVINTTDGISFEYDDSQWDRAFKDERTQEFGKKVKALMYRGIFNMPENIGDASIRFFYKSMGKQQSVFINGKQLADNIVQEKTGNDFVIDKSLLRPGKNVIVITATPLLKQHSWDGINMDAGLFQVIHPAPVWKRKLFSGLAQVIVQPTGEPGEIVLKAQSEGLQAAEVKITVQ